MSASEIVERCRRLGVGLRVIEDGRLEATAAGTLIDDELDELLHAYRNEVVAHLRTTAPAVGPVAAGELWTFTDVPMLGERIIVVRSFRVLDEHPELYAYRIPVIDFSGFAAMLKLSKADQQISYGRFVGIAVTQDMRRLDPPDTPPTAPFWPDYAYGAPLPPDSDAAGRVK